MEAAERLNIDLPAVPDKDVGFCPACYNIDPNCSIWDTSDQRKKKNFNKHCKVSDHKVVRNANLTCDICNAKFDRRAKLADHPCQKTFDHDDFVEYTMLDLESRMHKMLIKLPELELMNCVFEEKIILKNVWPPLSIKGSARSQKTVDYSEFGNIHGREFIEKALKQKIQNNQANSLILDKNIRVLKGTGPDRMFDLGPQYTKPVSPLFRVKETPDHLQWEVSLVSPPEPKKDALHSASVTQLMDTFYADEKSQMEEEDEPKLYPTLDKLNESTSGKGIADEYHPKKLKDEDLQYLGICKS